MSTFFSFTATGGFPTAAAPAAAGEQRGGGDRAWTSSTWASTSGKRIQKDMADLNVAGSEWSAGPKNDNLYHWIATVLGPAGTPYEGGVFHCNIDPSSRRLARRLRRCCDCSLQPPPPLRFLSAPLKSNPSRPLFSCPLGRFLSLLLS